MSHKVTRLEKKDDGRIFVNIEIRDETGIYNFPRWLTQDECESISKNQDSLGGIVDDYVLPAQAMRRREIETEKYRIETDGR